MPIWIPLLIAALGTAAQSKQVKAAGQRSRAEMRIGRDKERKVEEAQRADVLKSAEQFDPAVRQEGMDAKAEETAQRIEDVLSANKVSTEGGAGYVPEKTLELRAQSTREKANRASIMAALNANVRAPQDQGFTEGLDLSRLNAEGQGRNAELRRIGDTTRTLATLEGKTNPRAMMVAGLMQQLGLTMASGSIMSGLQSPGTPGANATPVPNYTKPDAFGTAGIK